MRSLLLANIKSCTETVDEMVNIVAYGYGTGYKDIICTLMISKKGIKIGFNKGATLSDPEKILAGSGKVHKYAAINSETDLKNPALSSLIEMDWKPGKSGQHKKISISSQRCSLLT